VELNKTYDKSREQEIYKNWLEKGYFKANTHSDKKPYTIMMPPPNITSQLHMGHALNNSIQDILIRFKRMQGYETLWMPGTDHAAIATEVVVVNALAKEGITKDDLGREKFLEKMWDWYDVYGARIIDQLQKVGCSADWDRTRFTMDEGLSKAVLEVFVRFYNERKIYKGERLINWCVHCETSISDAEVDHEDREGALYHFQYPLEDSNEFLAFATTRPETMLGDTAIAVNPDDERYTALIGKYVMVPFVNRRIPVVADNYVDKAYGTGVVKVTPAHDPNDFEIGVRHNLPRVNIMNDDGTINGNGAHFEGLPREAARKQIIAEMTALGLYIKTEPLVHSVGEHDRCKTVVEPLLKLQWFVKMDELAKPALEAYENGTLKFNRERFGKIYAHWLNNIRDWCISRQLWWGHQIPAYYCPKGHITVAAEKPIACCECGSTELIQDEDVLDTWFSSALWPFSTLGWPSKTPELKKFYPGNTLVTDRGIIFNWVVRMVFMGIEFMGDVPFHDVFINGTVNDDQGRKMSKSLGNGIDPLDIIEEYGADALRLMLFSGNAVDNDTRFFRERLDPARNFLNKLWNATRFVLMNLDDDVNQNGTQQAFGSEQQHLATEDKWILSRLNALVQDVTEKNEMHEIGMAAQKIVDFAWDEFCDWYVEMVKPRLYGGKDGNPEAQTSRAAAQMTLRTVLITITKLLHPIAPFITEDLFLALQHKEETIMLSAWPHYIEAMNNLDAEKDIERIKEAVKSIRMVRTDKQVPPSQKIGIVVIPQDEPTEYLFSEMSSAIKLLAGANEVTVTCPGIAAPEKAIAIAATGAVIYLPMDALIDTDKERARLTKEITKLEGEIARINGKLSNEGFVAKAPEALINAEKEKRIQFTEKLAAIKNELAAL